MKFSALALDYDGTIARDGALDPEVRSAIAEVRSRGIAVVIVTGRILEELRQVTGGLGFVDAVVAENGAVLDFPGGSSRLIGHPAQPIFLEELRRRGIEFKAGQCVVETDATWAPQVLAIIRWDEFCMSPLGDTTIYENGIEFTKLCHDVWSRGRQPYWCFRARG
jgi:hypothetical protein